MQWAKDMQGLLKEINKAQIDNPDLDKGANKNIVRNIKKYWLKVMLNAHHQIKVAGLKLSEAD